MVTVERTPTAMITLVNAWVVNVMDTLTSVTQILEHVRTVSMAQQVKQ